MTLDRLQWSLNLLGGIALVSFLFLALPGLVNSDAAAGILLADQLLAEGRLVSREWFYVSDSLTLDGRTQVAMLGVALLGPTLAAYVFTAIAGAIALAAAAWWLSRSLGARPVHAVTAGLVLLVGPSVIYQDMVVGMTISLQMALVATFVTAIGVHAFGKGRNLPAFVLVALVALVMAASSPKKALAYALLPALAATGAWCVLALARGGPFRQHAPRLLGLMALAVVAWACGWWVHEAFLESALMRAGYARLDLSASTDRFAANAGLAADLLGVFAGARSEPVPGIRAVLVAITWTTLVLAVGWRVLRGRPDRLAFACLFALAGLGVLSTYLLTYDDIKIHYGVYYLLVPYAALVCAAAAVDEPNATRGSRLAARVAMMVLLVAGIANAAWASVQGTSGYRGISKNQLVSRDARVELLAWLREQGLQRGYANFWDANAITLESGGEVRVTSTLTPRGGRPLRRHSWLQEADRYEFNPGADGARWFIAIPRRRTAVRLPDACRPTAWEGEVGAYRVYVYERPMPDCIPPATAGERRHGGSPTRKPGD